MKVDIEISNKYTSIKFNLKDLTTADELISNCCAMANSYSFEAGSLVSIEFEKFIIITKTSQNMCGSCWS